MRENKLKTLWKNGGVAVNGWLGIPSSASAESMARCGWDSVVVDMQHGLVDYTDAVPMLQAISQTDATPMVRVPWNMPDIIMKSLDAGAYGVVCPMINTPAECEEFIQNCRYAPRGRRSFGPIRAVMYGGADYWKYANETILTIAMIETQQALDNLDAILKTDGLDSIYVGPSDLGLSLGFQPGPDPTTPKVAEAIKFIVDRAKAAKIPAGIHCARAVMGARDDRPRLSARHARQRQLADDGRGARGHRRDARGRRGAGAEAGEPCTRQRGAKAALLPRPPWSAVRIERSRRAEPRPRPKCVRSGSR